MKNKMFNSFATAPLLWQHFLLAWACRSEFDGELISVCSFPSRIFFYFLCSCSDIWPPLWPTGLILFGRMEKLHFYIFNISAFWTFASSAFGKASDNTWNFTKASQYTSVTGSTVTPFLPVRLLQRRKEFEPAIRNSFLWLFKHISCVLIQTWGKMGYNCKSSERLSDNCQLVALLSQW